MNISQDCNDEYERKKRIDNNQCIIYRWYPTKEKRTKCKLCYAEECITCVDNILKIKVVQEEEHKEVSSSTITLRLLTLETRMNELEQILRILEKRKRKDSKRRHIHKKN